VKQADHLIFFHANDFALSHGAGGCQAQWLPDQASLAKEIIGSEDRDHRFLSLFGRNDTLDLSLQDINDRVRGIALRKNNRIFAITLVRSALTASRQK
jgi:hypothetical protein